MPLQIRTVVAAGIAVSAALLSTRIDYDCNIEFIHTAHAADIGTPPPKFWQLHDLVKVDMVVSTVSLNFLQYYMCAVIDGIHLRLFVFVAVGIQLCFVISEKITYTRMLVRSKIACTAIMHESYINNHILCVCIMFVLSVEYTC